MVKRRSSMIVVLLVAALFTGCFGVASVDKLVLSADAEMVQQGKSVNLTVKGTDKKGKEVEITDIKWTLDDEAKGTLEEDGAKAVFTAGAEVDGIVKVTVTASKKSTSIEITVTADDPASKLALQEKVATAKTLKASKTEGDKPGQIAKADHDALQAEIDAAQAVFDNADATAEQVTNAITTLQAAMTTFEGKEITGDLHLDRTDWTAGASDNGNYAEQILDGDSETSWHGSWQVVGKWLELDMQADQTFNLITIQNILKDADDLPRGFEVFLALNGDEAVYGTEPVFSGGYPRGESDGIEHIVLDELQTARWIKIVLTAYDDKTDLPDGKYFRVGEMFVGTRY